MALQGQLAIDRADPKVQALADTVLQTPARSDLHAAAWFAKADQSYRTVDDSTAIASAEQGLRLVQLPSRIASDLSVLRIRALVRSGDPARAVARLGDASVTALPDSERFGLAAVAYDRNGDVAQAILAYARWRAVVPERSAQAAYAMRRLVQLGRSVEAEDLSSRMRVLEPGWPRTCVQAIQGIAPERGAPEWVEDCHFGTRTAIGILLPRTGPLSALADPQLAATSVAVSLLSNEEGPAIAWEDAGSTATEARAAALALVARGATILVGPVGPENVRAVAAAVGSEVPIVVPGEAVDETIGAAPSLEQRVAALVARGRELGATRFVIVAPENGYGIRAAKAIQRALSRSEARAVMERRYDPATTSFADVLAPIESVLRPGTAVLLPDHISRVELVVRQIARSRPDSGTGEGGPLLMTTAEGLTEAALGSGHEALEGVWTAPVARPTRDSASFIEAFRVAHGETPSDQALLVFFALRRAVTGEPAPGAQALLVSGGQLATESNTPSRRP